MCIPKVTQCRVRSKHSASSAPTAIKTAKNLDDKPYAKKKNKCYTVLKHKILGGADKHGNVSHEKNIESVSKVSVCKRVKQHASKAWNGKNENELSPGFIHHRPSFSIRQYLAPADYLPSDTTHKTSDRLDNAFSRRYFDHSCPQNYVRLSIDSPAEIYETLSISTQNGDDDFASPLLDSRQSELHAFGLSSFPQNTRECFQFTSNSFNDSGWGSMSPMPSGRCTIDQGTIRYTPTSKRQFYKAHVDCTALHDVTFKSISKSESQLRVAVEHNEKNIQRVPDKCLYPRKPEKLSWSMKAPLDVSLAKTPDRTAETSLEPQFCTSTNNPEIHAKRCFDVSSKPGRRMSYDSWQRSPLSEQLPPRTESTLSIPAATKPQKAFFLPPLFVTKRVSDHMDAENKPQTNENILYAHEDGPKANRDTVCSEFTDASSMEKFTSIRPKPLDTSKRSMRQVKRNSVHSRSSGGSQEDLDKNTTFSEKFCQEPDYPIEQRAGLCSIDQQSEIVECYSSTTEEDKHTFFTDNCTPPKPSNIMHLYMDQRVGSPPGEIMTNLHGEDCTRMSYREVEVFKAPGTDANLRGPSLFPTQQLTVSHPELGYKCDHNVQIDTKTPIKPTVEDDMLITRREKSIEPKTRHVSTYGLAPRHCNLDEDVDVEDKDSLASRSEFTDYSECYGEGSRMEEQCLSSTVFDTENSPKRPHSLNTYDELLFCKLKNDTFGEYKPLMQSTFLNTDSESHSGMLLTAPETLQLDLHTTSEIFEQLPSDELSNAAQLSSIVSTDSGVENHQFDPHHGKGHGASQIKYSNFEEPKRYYGECLGSPSEGVRETAQHFVEVSLSTPTETGDVIDRHFRFDEPDSGVEQSLSSGYFRSSVLRNSDILPKQNVPTSQSSNPSCDELVFGVENEHLYHLNGGRSNINDDLSSTSFQFPVISGSPRTEISTKTFETQPTIKQPYSVSGSTWKDCGSNVPRGSRLETGIEYTGSSLSMIELLYSASELVQSTFEAVSADTTPVQYGQLVPQREHELKPPCMVFKEHSACSMHMNRSCNEKAFEIAPELNSDSCITSTGTTSVNQYQSENKTDREPTDRSSSNNMGASTVVYASLSPIPTEPNIIEISRHNKREVYREDEIMKHRPTSNAKLSTPLVEADLASGDCGTVEKIATDIVESCADEEPNKDTPVARSSSALPITLGSPTGLSQASTTQHAQYTLHMGLDGEVTYSGDQTGRKQILHCTELPRKEIDFPVSLLPVIYNQNLGLLEETKTMLDSQVQPDQEKCTFDVGTTTTTSELPEDSPATGIQRSAEIVGTKEETIRNQGSETTLRLIGPLQENMPHKLETEEPSTKWRLANLDDLRIENNFKLVLRNQEPRRDIYLISTSDQSSIQTENNFENHLGSKARGSSMHKVSMNSAFSEATTATDPPSTERLFELEHTKKSCSERDQIDDKIGYNLHDSNTSIHRQEHSDSQVPQGAHLGKTEIMADTEHLLVEKPLSSKEPPKGFPNLFSDRSRTPGDSLLVHYVSSTPKAAEETSTTFNKPVGSYAFEKLGFNLSTCHRMNPIVEGASFVHSKGDQNIDLDTNSLQASKDTPNAIPIRNQASTRGNKPSALTLSEILPRPSLREVPTHDVPNEESFELSTSIGNNADWQGGEIIVLAKQNIVIQTKSSEESECSGPLHATGPSGDVLRIASPCFDQPSEINMFLKESEIIPTYIRPTYSAPLAGRTNVQDVVEGVPSPKEASIVCSEQMLSNEFSMKAKEVDSWPFITSTTDQSTLDRIVLIAPKVEDLQAEESSIQDNTRMPSSQFGEISPCAHDNLAVTATSSLVKESMILSSDTEAANPFELHCSKESSSVSSTGIVSPGRTVIARYCPPQSLCNEVEERRTEILSEELSIESAIAAPRQWTLLDRWSAWTFGSLTSTFHFATIYIPRNVYWFYMATFESRDQLLRAMAGRSLNLAVTWSHIQATLRNPIFVASLFVGLTTLLPHVQHWPDGALQLLMSTRLHVLPLWVSSRPVLSYVGHVILSCRTPFSLNRPLAIQSPFR